MTEKRLGNTRNNHNVHKITQQKWIVTVLLRIGDIFLSGSRALPVLREHRVTLSIGLNGIDCRIPIFGAESAAF